MNSDELHGFCSWQTWGQRAVNSVPRSPGVYVFRLASRHLIERLRGTSDLIYFGCAGKTDRGLQGRLDQHLRARPDELDLGWCLPRVTKERGSLEFTWKECHSGELAETEEGIWLYRFWDEHLEYPALNDKGPNPLASFLCSKCPGVSTTELVKRLALIDSLRSPRAEADPVT